MNVDRIEQARVFVAAANSTSFKDAAAVLKKSPSGVTAAIQGLEQSTHPATELFLRLRRGIRLTSEGEALLPIAEALLASAEAFEQQLTELNLVRPTIRVGTIQGAWFDLLKRAQEILNDDVELEPVAINPFWPVQPLLSGEVTYALLPAASDHDRQLDRLPIFEEPRTVSLSAQGPLGDRESATLEELDEGSWMGSPPGADRLFTTAHRCDDVRGRAPRSVDQAILLNTVDIGHAIRSGKVQIASMTSISSLFGGKLSEDIVDVQIEDTTPWRIDLAGRRSGPARLALADLAVALRQAVTESDNPGMTPCE